MDKEEKHEGDFESESICPLCEEKTRREYDAFCGDCKVTIFEGKYFIVTAMSLNSVMIDGLVYDSCALMNLHEIKLYSLFASVRGTDIEEIQEQSYELLQILDIMESFDVEKYKTIF